MKGVFLCTLPTPSWIFLVDRTLSNWLETVYWTLKWSPNHPLSKRATHCSGTRWHQSWDVMIVMCQGSHELFCEELHVLFISTYRKEENPIAAEQSGNIKHCPVVSGLQDTNLWNFQNPTVKYSQLVDIIKVGSLSVCQEESLKCGRFPLLVFAIVFSYWAWWEMRLPRLHFETSTQQKTKCGWVSATM